jgi:hypothetical protein
MTKLCNLKCELMRRNEITNKITNTMNWSVREVLLKNGHLVLSENVAPPKLLGEKLASDKAKVFTNIQR